MFGTFRSYGAANELSAEGYKHPAPDGITCGHIRSDGAFTLESAATSRNRSGRRSISGELNTSRLVPNLSGSRTSDR